MLVFVSSVFALSICTTYSEDLMKEQKTYLIDMKSLKSYPDWMAMIWPCCGNLLLIHLYFKDFSANYTSHQIANSFALFINVIFIRDSPFQTWSKPFWISLDDWFSAKAVLQQHSWTRFATVHRENIFLAPRTDGNGASKKPPHGWKQTQHELGRDEHWWLR